MGNLLDMINKGKLKIRKLDLERGKEIDIEINKVTDKISKKYAKRKSNIEKEFLANSKKYSQYVIDFLKEKREFTLLDADEHKVYDIYEWSSNLSEMVLTREDESDYSTYSKIEEIKWITYSKDIFAIIDSVIKNDFMFYNIDDSTPSICEDKEGEVKMDIKCNNKDLHRDKYDVSVSLTEDYLTVKYCYDYETDVDYGEETGRSVVRINFRHK